MTIKPIRWFESAIGIPAAFHNPNPKSCVVCLNYKDYNSISLGVEPWWLTHRVVPIPLIGEWGSDDWWVALQQGALQAVNYAGYNESIGFKDGDFYGIFQVHHEVGRSPRVLVGLAYANAATPLTSSQGMIEQEYPNYEHHHWLTSQFAIPLQIEVQLRGEIPEVIPRVSRYRRTLVI